VDPLLDAAPVPEDPGPVEAEVEPEGPALEALRLREEPPPQPEALAVDTHCHLFLMDAEPAEVVSAARAAGVGRLVCVGIDPETSRRSTELAQSFRGVFATAGMHPHTASELDRRAGAVIEELLSDPLVIGVGETGLDYYRRLSPVEDQHRAFRTHIALSRETGKPLVVHVRDAWEDALAILDEEGADRVLLHCFSGDRAIAREAQDRGYFVSFAANLTYPKAERLREAAALVTEDHLIVETDSPFLPPQVLRGRPNSPSNLPAVIEAVAAARGMDADAVIRATARASAAVFPLLR
jgi:TatD DNase family protein